MADFALWATACETALWAAGTFWSAYNSNREEAVEGVIDADPVAAAARILISERTEWTAAISSDLLGELTNKVDERVSKSRTGPATLAHCRVEVLRRAATFLRKVGIEVRFEREGRARTRIGSYHGIRLRKCVGTTVRTVRTARTLTQSHTRNRLHS